MLIPDHTRTLQRRRMVFAYPLRVWGQAFLLHLLLVIGLIVVGVMSYQRPVWPIWVGGMAIGLAAIWLLSLALAYQRLALLQKVEGKNPQVNRAAIRDWVREQRWALREDRPDYVIVEQPMTWLRGPRQITFLLQGRDLWVHAAGRNRYLDCIAPLVLIGSDQLRRKAGLGVAARLSRHDWGSEDS